MVESKDFIHYHHHDDDDSSGGADHSPPLVPVPAGEPLDVWHLEAVPVVAQAPPSPPVVSALSWATASAPSHMYEESDHEESLVLVDSFPTAVTAEQDYGQEEQQEQQQDEDPEHNVTVGAGVASGVVGLLVGGPFFALFLGLGTAYASQKQGAWADAAKAVGHVALTAQEQARRVNDKHHVIERSRQAARNAWAQAHDLDRKHHILENLAHALHIFLRATRDFVEKHRIMEKSAHGLRNLFAWAARRVQHQLDQARDHAIRRNGRQALVEEIPTHHVVGGDHHYER